VEAVRNKATRTNLLDDPNPGDRLIGHCDCGGATYVGINPLLGCDWSHGSHAGNCAYIASIGGGK
jgi:hypothetical protein